jgi:predicted Ser/Thr protein kinase
MRVDHEAETRLSGSEPDPFLGRTFDGYRVEELIGRGGMGEVYKATQLSLGRPVALKILPEGFVDDPQFRDRFEREVDIMSRLSHPNVVTVFERGTVDGRPYIAMEYVRGTSLRAVVRRGPLPAAEALVVVRGVLSALEHAHGQGIVHRDIKPENVLVAPGGVVKVADFGLSRLLGDEQVTRLTRSHVVLGTYEYMAPEQREQAREADERSDLYATGVVLYEMIAGELPIGSFEPLSRKRPAECDRRIDDIVEKSLQKAPERRYRDAAEMGGAVSGLLSAVPVAEPEPETAPETPHRRVKGADWHLGLQIVAFVFFMILASRGFVLGGEKAVGVIVAIACVAVALPLVPRTMRWIGRHPLVILGAIPLLLLVGLWFTTPREPAAPSAVATTGPVYSVENVVGEWVGTPARTLTSRLSADPAVREWLKRFAPAAAGKFPFGVVYRWERVGPASRLHVRLEGDEYRGVRPGHAAFAAIGLALEKASGGAFRRTVFADAATEAQFAGMPPPAAR